MRKYYLLICLLSCIFLNTACNNSLDDFFNKELGTDKVQMSYIDTLIVAHWNIGHFALGRSEDTIIRSEDSETMSSLYRAVLDSVDADIFGVCEYNPLFSLGGEKTSAYIFGKYPYHCIGSKVSYNCNAIFSHIIINESNVLFFEKCVQHRYYVYSKFLINGQELIFVETHLDWNEGALGKSSRTDQILTLIEKFNNYPYVILCADYNVYDIDEFKPFADAGFNLASGKEHGVINTYPSSNPLRCVDNIIVKGLDILDVEAILDKRLSDHILLKSRLIFKK